MKALFLLDTESKLFTKREKALYWLLLTFFIIIFIPRAPVLSNALLGILVLFSFSFNSLKEKIYLLKNRTFVLLLIVYYLLHVVSALFSANKDEAIAQLLIRLPLLLFPIALGTIVISNELRDRIILCIASIISIVAFSSASQIPRPHLVRTFINDDWLLFNSFDRLGSNRLLSLALFLTKQSKVMI